MYPSSVAAINVWVTSGWTARQSIGEDSRKTSTNSSEWLLEGNKASEDPDGKTNLRLLLFDVVNENLFVNDDEFFWSTTRDDTSVVWRVSRRDSSSEVVHHRHRRWIEDHRKRNLKHWHIRIDLRERENRDEKIDRNDCQRFERIFSSSRWSTRFHERVRRVIVIWRKKPTSTDRKVQWKEKTKRGVFLLPERSTKTRNRNLLRFD